jgi:protein O-GlcNAc transferase
LALNVPQNDAFQRALAALQARNIKEAEHLFREALRKDPAHIGALNMFGAMLTQLGRYAEAETYLRRASQEYASSDATLYNYGLVLKALNRSAEALERFTQALAINSAVAETWNNRGTVFNDLGRVDEAIADFDRAIQLNPRYADAFCNKAKSLTILKRLEEASSAIERALTLKPDLAEAWLGRGNIFAALKRYGEALAAYEKALALKPAFAEAWLASGDAFRKLKRNRDALSAFDHALALRPEFPEAWVDRGNMLAELKRYDEALAAFDRALALKSDLAEAWLGRGNVLHGRKRYDDAATAYETAQALKPDLAETWFGRGNTFNALKRYGDASTAYDKALELKPDFAEAWVGRGNALNALKRHDDALAACERALTLNPDLAEAWVGRGNVLTTLNRYDDAFAACERALTLDPDLAEAWLGCGIVLTNLARYADAFAAYDKALALEPDLSDAAGGRLHSKLYICDWTNLEAELAQHLAAIRAGEPASILFLLLSIPSTAADQLQSARRHVQDQPAYAPIWQGEVYSHDRIRVAYLSSDFRDHAVGYLAAGLFEQHDKSRFEITAISFGPDDRSVIRQRVKHASERFVDVRDSSDQDIANLIRRLEIDIAVDLNGFTADSRPGVLARRPAPIQVNYLGYPGTMGADYIDYILADPTVIAEDQCRFYAEQVVWLPDCYQVNDDRRRIAERAPSRGECGLPDSAFVFCCFNNSYKITPSLFDVWMRLLQATDGSVLWLLEANPTASANLRRQAEQRGVSAQRLIFAPRAGTADHLARHRRADLFLDTLPYNAHTTASDALWAGVPVLTCLGETFAGRVAASLLKAVGLDELITRSLEEYEALAVKLARDPSYLSSIREKLARNRATFPLFDTKRSARQIEAAYRMMWERYQERDMPRALSIRSSSRPIGVV